MNIYLMIVDLNYKDKKQCTHRSVDVQKRPKEGGGYFKCVQRRCLEWEGEESYDWKLDRPAGNLKKHQNDGMSIQGSPTISCSFKGKR